MSKRLREGVEQAKRYYIDKISKSEFYQDSKQELRHLPLNQLQDILRQERALETKKTMQTKNGNR